MCQPAAYMCVIFLLCLQVALHMRAYRTFKDVKGVTRKNGEEWLIKMADTEAHIPDVYEEVHVVCVRVARVSACALVFACCMCNVPVHVLCQLLCICTCVCVCVYVCERESACVYVYMCYVDLYTYMYMCV